MSTSTSVRSISMPTVRHRRGRRGADLIGVGVGAIGGDRPRRRATRSLRTTSWRGRGGGDLSLKVTDASGCVVSLAPNDELDRDDGKEAPVARDRGEAPAAAPGEVVAGQQRAGAEWRRLFFCEDGHK